MFPSLLAYFVALITLTVAQDSRPLPPSQDPFYQQPENISNYAPGAVIRSRQVSNRLQPFLPLPVDVSVKEVHQYLYRTTDSLGDAVAAATTILVPYDADPNKLLSYQTAYDSANPDCSPSYTLRFGTAEGGLAGIVGPNSTLSIDTPFLAASLNQGWYVVTSDYEGLEAQFVAGLQAGYATLDSVRVALAVGPSTLGLSPTARYAMWGYSGGSLASEWAAELAASYAPELRFEGAALGGLIANVTAVATTINKSLFAGLGFAGIIGLSRAYPNLTDYLEASLLPDKRDEFFERGSYCLVGNTLAGAGQDLYSYFSTGEGALSDPVPASVLAAAGQMGVYGTPQMPLYIYHARGDEVSPSVETDEYVQQFCAQGGVTIEYYRNLFGEHATEAILGSANALGWVADRLDGKPLETTTGTCKTENIFISTIEPDTIPLIGLELISVIQTILGGMLGEGLPGL
ncbi:secretory lipase-domain-containing protein [Macrophomina phaseolina]|uniref:Secretory lipase-domain-containing protein n=1 Tax=Macrophomina phaseolina TaxID=35725 RepID=A0ABQ8GRN9_9PEZI|nr:secretory lipase-domain-containing protein [Macrophomina phaseolina]